MDSLKLFWDWFIENESGFREIIDSPNPELMDALLDHLHAIDDELYFEVGFDPDDQLFDLIITAECRVEKFELVKRIVLIAPRLEQWKFTPLKPAMGKGFKICYEGVDIDPAVLDFVLMKSQSQEMFGLQVLFPGHEEVGSNLLNGLYIACDNLLGEERSTRFIGKIWCVDELEYEITGKLDDLSEYIP